MMAIWHRYWWAFILALIVTLIGNGVLALLDLKDDAGWKFLLGWLACSVFMDARRPWKQKAPEEAEAAEFSTYLRERADHLRAKGFSADDTNDLYDLDLDDAARKLDVAGAALKSGSTLFADFTAEISMRMYRWDELKDPDAWNDFDAPIYDGTFAGIRDELDEARRIVAMKP